VISSDRLELFTPLERDEIMRLNTTVPLMMKSREPDIQKKALLLNQIPILFTYYSEKSSDDSFLKLISDFLDLFLYYCNAGYYTPQEMFPVLSSMKKALSLANQMNKPQFVKFMFKYVREFFKFALYWLTDSVIARLRRSRRGAAVSFGRVVEDSYIPIVRPSSEDPTEPKHETFGMSLSRNFSLSNILGTQQKVVEELDYAHELEYLKVKPDLPGASFGKQSFIT
jgi:hypothetical protein